MGLDSGDGVKKELNDRFEDLIVVELGEGRGQVNRQLADAVKGCVSNSRLGMLQMLHNQWQFLSNLINLLYIFSKLREQHESSISKSPVLFLHTGYKEFLQKGHCHLLAESSDYYVYVSHA